MIACSTCGFTRPRRSSGDGWLATVLVAEIIASFREAGKQIQHRKVVEMPSTARFSQELVSFLSGTSDYAPASAGPR